MTPKPPPPADPAPPDGFDSLGDGRIVATRDIEVEFYPRGCKRPSTALLVNKGAVITRAAYERRVDTYRRYSRMEVK